MSLEEFIANYEDIEIAKLNNMDPSSQYTSAQNPHTQGLSKQQRVHLARGASPKGVIGQAAMAGVGAESEYSGNQSGYGGSKGGHQLSFTKL